MIILIHTLIGLLLARPQEDLVDTDAFAFPFTYPHLWYSGYLNVTTKSAIHYVFFESQNNPSKDPLLLWLNGGPGCSSLIGMMTENGPITFKPNSTIVPSNNKPQLNEYSWNKFSNILYLQSPPGVGFSTGSPNSSDQESALDNFIALLFFFQKFPEFFSHQLYLSGESYSGIYVPWLAHRIYLYNQEDQTSFKINLKGILVGNGCTHPKQCYQAGIDGNSVFTYEYLFSHYFFTFQQFREYQQKCSIVYNQTQCNMQKDKLDLKFKKTNTSLYNIYGTCFNQNISSLYRAFKGKRNADDLSCEDIIGIHTFMNNQRHQQLMNVQKLKWTECSEEVSNFYIMNPNASYWIYPILHDKIRIWVYSGDADACVPISGTKWWMQRIREQNGWGVNQQWRGWYVGDVLGGFTEVIGNIRFVSVRDAGHMVPSTQQKQSYQMVVKFILNEDL